MPRPAKPLTLLFDETARFNEMEWAVFRMHISSPEFSMAKIADRHNLTPQRAGLIYRSILAEIIRRAERHGATADLAMLKKNPRRSGRTAEAWTAIAWKYRNQPAPKLSIEQPPRFWFSRRAADRLAAAGYTTLRHVVEAINRFGVRWFDAPRSLPSGQVQAIAGIGLAQARQIVAWLVARQDVLCVAIEPYAVSPRTSAAVKKWKQSGVVRPDIITRSPVPLERIAPALSLSGATGRNRAPLSRCQIDAYNDLDAIRAWLAQHEAGGNTWLAYRREIERFLAWSLLDRGKPFSSLGSDDCTAYRDWILDPQPVDRWVGAVMPRWHPEWRPFSAPLSRRSAIAACNSVRSCMSWLVAAGYLASNPWSIVNLKPLADGALKIDINRAFSSKQITQLRDLFDLWAEETPTGAAAARLARQRFIALFGISSGLRLAELASLRLGAFSRSGDQLWMTVIGKGKKRRKVPLPATTGNELQRYLLSRELPPSAVDCPSDIPLIGANPLPWQRTTDKEAPLSTARLSQIIKTLFTRVAATLGGRDGERFAVASAHWMRHTYGSRLTDSGVPLKAVQLNLGHADIRTTSIYLHEEDDARWSAVQSLCLFAE
jgi:site-specific recombinase XerD